MPVLLKCLQHSPGEQENNKAIMSSDPCDAVRAQPGMFCRALYHNSQSPSLSKWL